MHTLRYLLVTISLINIAVHASDSSELLDDPYSPWESASLGAFVHISYTPSTLDCPSSASTPINQNEHKRLSPSCSSLCDGDQPLSKYQRTGSTPSIKEEPPIYLSKIDLGNVVYAFDLQVRALTHTVNVMLQELHQLTPAIEQASLDVQEELRQAEIMEQLAQEWMLKFNTPITQGTMSFERSLECIHTMLAQIPDTTSLLCQRIQIAEANCYLRECQKKQNQKRFDIAQEHLNVAKKIIPLIKPKYLQECRYYGSCRVPRAIISRTNLLKKLRTVEQRQKKYNMQST